MPNLTNSTTTKRGSYTSNSTQYYWWETFPRSSPTQTFETTAYSKVINRSGVNTPGWLTSKRPKVPPTNPFTFSCVETYYSTGYKFESIQKDAARQISGYTSSASGVLGSSPTLPAAEFVDSSALGAAIRQAQAKLLDRIKDQKTNLLQAYAERAQTRQLVGDALLSLAKAYGKARKGDLFGAAQAMGVSPRHPPGKSKSAATSVSQKWLELQYGWKPLLGDIYGLAEAYHQLSTKKPPVERARAQVSARGDKQFGPYDTGDSLRREFGQEVVDVKIGCYFSANGSSPSPSRTLAQLGITNPALLAWELLPWSFVVDWFLPIGQLLSNLDATAGLSFAGGYQTIFRKSTSRTTWTFKTQGTTVRSGFAEAVQTRISVTRSPLSAFPSPSFPPLKDPFSHTHFYNALALFQTNCRK